MAAFEVEKELRNVGSAPAENMSPLVRARLDATYASLPGQHRSHSKPGTSRVRKYALGAAAAVILGSGVFSSALISPAMADSLRNLPLIGSIFSSLQGDTGLRSGGELGLVTSVNRSASYDDVKLEVTETLYDGSRAAFLLTVTAPNLVNGSYDNGKKSMKLSSAVQDIFLSVNGQRQGDPGTMLQGGVFFGSAGDAHPNTLVFEQVLDASTGNAFPGDFNAEVTVVLDGIDHSFTVEVPFHRTATKTVDVNPTAVQTHEDLTFSVTRVQATPVTTRLITTLALNHASSLTSRDERRLSRIGIAVFDDQGRQLTALNGDGQFEGNLLTFDRRYASTPGDSRYLVIKPFTIRDDFAEKVQEDQFLKELELKIELPAAK